MKRSIQEIVELVIFALIALLLLTGVLLLTGWLIGLLGSLFIWAAGLLWLLLRWITPVVIIVAAVYALIKLLQRQRVQRSGAQSPVGAGAASSVPSAQTATDTATDVPPPADAPITTVAASGEPVDPTNDLYAGGADAPAGGASAVAASSEPVPTVDVEPVSGGEADPSASVVEESAEPITAVDAEPVEPNAETRANGDEKQGEG